jgi:hypothetical protein
MQKFVALARKNFSVDSPPDNSKKTKTKPKGKKTS